MNLKHALMPLAALTLAGCMSQPDYRETEATLPTVESVDLDRYAGTWHEIARYPNWFERDCVTATAEYAQLPDGKISVVNSCVKSDGEIDVAEGKARVVEGSNGSKLKVKFAPSWVPFAEGDYWILALEPDYSAALVGSPDGKYLWILARSRQIDPSVLGRLKDRATALGYDTAPLEMTVQPQEG